MPAEQSLWRLWKIYRTCVSDNWRGVTAKTAIALGEYFGQTPEFRMNAQKVYGLLRELVENGEEIRSRVRRCAKDWTTAG